MKVALSFARELTGFCALTEHRRAYRIFDSAASQARQKHRLSRGIAALFIGRLIGVVIIIGGRVDSEGRGDPG